MANMWAVGDYPSWGDRFAEVGRRLVADVGVDGLDVLDVATGHGPTAVAAALRGGRVTGLDLTPQLLAVARRRAAGAGVEVTWVEADMTAMPLPDASFDRVLSTFGAMVAPDPRAMAVELVRVCRPGGVIASTAWTADAVYAKIGGIVAGFLPDEPEDAAADEQIDEEVDDAPPFAGLPVEVRSAARTVAVRWPSADALIGSLATFGPLAAAVAAIQAAGRWPAARGALTAMLAEEAEPGSDGLVIEVPYELTVAARHG